MSESALEAIREIIQEDVNGRGLRADPAANLITASAGDFAAACRSLAETPAPAVGIVTGFFIPHAQPPAGETDGPLGALFLARALVRLGGKVVLVTDRFAEPALAAGLEASHLGKAVQLLVLPGYDEAQAMSPEEYWRRLTAQAGRLTHLIALERAGPSHTPESVRSQHGATAQTVVEFRRAVPAAHHNRCHTMRGRDITTTMSPAHWLFESAARQNPPVTTVGIGDGGNEIGMGKIPWEVIRRNIPAGEVVACRVAADYLIVCGISNWGAYGLAAGVGLLRGVKPEPTLFDPERERHLLRTMVERGPLVDGVTGRPAVSVDGLSFERYAEPLRKFGRITLGGRHP